VRLLKPQLYAAVVGEVLPIKFLPREVLGYALFVSSPWKARAIASQSCQLWQMYSRQNPASKLFLFLWIPIFI
jgi:hypothetical protein